MASHAVGKKGYLFNTFFFSDRYGHPAPEAAVMLCKGLPLLLLRLFQVSSIWQDV
jgi:hypothetical protein